ncbi:MAG: bifunctional precorrin-2 dehydrogenase/sirohydrochlorin ferrochelatase [Desulfovibrio sp.]|jgi:precorrin-2 dehydrogenase/sirohydrochlorin ferrochelatase|nr:bifunctional precorrin-2 dehydrogenase/sirohydrochlorin ferrochelatase [Desulfovibrio sp.]
MRHYPLFLDLSSREVLVAGAGSVGRRKIRTLLKVPVKRITVVDPRPPRPPLPEAANLFFLERPFAPEDLDGKSLVFAATDSPEVNARLVSLCAQRQIWCNRADRPESGAFFVPAHAESDGITIAVGTEGKSPALAGVIRHDLENRLKNRYGPLLLVLGRLRPPLLALPEVSDPAGVLRALLASPLAEALERKDRAGAEDLLRRHLPDVLRPHIRELLHDL